MVSVCIYHGFLGQARLFVVYEHLHAPDGVQLNTVCFVQNIILANLEPSIRREKDVELPF